MPASGTTTTAGTLGDGRAGGRRTAGPRDRSARDRVEAANEMHLRLEADAVAVRDLLLDPADEGHHVRRAGARPGHDEVRVLLRHRGATLRGALQPEVLDHLRRMPALGVLEHAAAVRLGQRLGPAPPFPGVVHPGADAGRMAR